MRLVQLKSALLACLFLAMSWPAEADHFVCPEDSGDLLSPRVAKVAYRELMNTPFVSIGRTGAGVKTVFVLGSPWCPYCKRLYTLAQKKKLNIEFRFLGMSPKSGMDFVKLADQVLNGREGLQRTYGRAPYAAPRGLGGVAAKPLSDVSLFLSFLFEARYQPDIARIYRENNINRTTWGSPVLFAVTADKRMGPIPYAGIPKLDQMSRSSYFGALGGSSPRMKIVELLQLPVRNSSINTVGRHGTITKVYAYPSKDAPRLCTDGPSPVAGVIEAGGTKWLKARSLVFSRIGVKGKQNVVYGYVPVN